MRPTQIIDTIILTHPLQTALFIKGAPGGGKTECVSYACNKIYDNKPEHHRLIAVPSMQPEDVGVPYIREDRLHFALMDLLPFEGTDCPDSGIVTLDEWPQSDKPTEKVTANLIQQREVYGRKIKPGWQFIMTGNRQEDRAGAGRLLGHSANRVVHLNFESSWEDWIAWGTANGLHPDLLAFHRWNKGRLVNTYNPDQEINATQRSWTQFVSPYVDIVPPELAAEWFAGAVGDGAAAEFAKYLALKDGLVPMEVILRDPDRAPVPDQHDDSGYAQLYAVSTTLAREANADAFPAIRKYAKRLPGEFSTVLMLDSLEHGGRELMKTPEFKDWARNEGRDVLVGA